MSLRACRSRIEAETIHARMGVDLAYRMRRGRGFVHPPYEANGELIERAPGLYNAKPG